MPYGETKVYFDGSHYIAIPHTERPAKRRRIKLEETITVQDEVKDSVENTEPSISPINEELNEFEEVIEDVYNLIKSKLGDVGYERVLN